MLFEILPMPQSEWPIYNTLMLQSFESTMCKVWFPNGHTQADKDHMLASLQRQEQRYPGRAKFFKVVDSSLPDSDPLNKIVGISHWRVYPQRTAAEVAQEEADEEKEFEEFGFPPNANEEAVGEFFELVGRYQKKYMRETGWIFLALLATRPGYGRKGIGAMAMREGCAMADRLSVPMYLEGTSDGIELYKKWGYEIVDELPFDTSKYGLEEFRSFCMKRPAHAVEA